ncbi:hypothetical protein X945_5880 [Burkholderia pseudomallei ABCPW 107]|nr:hypothetical protein X945_5880 [Burkholderia pseudomallei ABCPW 107]
MGQRGGRALLPKPQSSVQSCLTTSLTPIQWVDCVGTGRNGQED